MPIFVLRGIMGTLANGTAIAVKKLSATKEGMDEFVEKSRTIASIKHPNLVTLMGCCVGNNQLLLIYEYIGTDGMLCGKQPTSLEDALFGSNKLRARLNWPTRYRICLGLAEGLAFLHEGSKQEIIHGDIKPANIILDDDLNPKIYDFGFAKFYHKQQLEGSQSYTAPEVKDRPVEASADVYSFGVVTLILISGRKVTTPRAGGDTEYLVEEAQKMDRIGNLIEIVDQDQNYVWEEADRILKLAIKCIDSRPFRPTMSTVVKILKKECSIKDILVSESKPEGD
ncbi:probable LRR receptor-like serine/threonine-protein kinase At1g53420 [Lycium ferocissimum]|uniref:probable LRR receptor-like serine/threonine-protein kinase At1g53420 n=1 Tax=Lycium ferocissimum TaxID=112874 RepID=UPI0028161A70|nr:probable LRR receptor-like serine/threonine-protein kinase At1g53420 [Lycium ferocissimum]